MNGKSSQWMGSGEDEIPRTVILPANRAVVSTGVVRTAPGRRRGRGFLGRNSTWEAPGSWPPGAERQLGGAEVVVSRDRTTVVDSDAAAEPVPPTRHKF